MVLTPDMPINRGYYMAARGYEFYLRVLKVSLTRSLRSLVRDTFSTILMKFLHKTQLEAHLRMHLRRRECRHEKLSGV